MCSYEFPVCNTASLVAIDILISKIISFKWMESEKVSKVKRKLECLVWKSWRYRFIVILLPLWLDFLSCHTNVVGLEQLWVG